MSYSKMKWFEDMENGWFPHTYRNNNDDNEATEKYVDVKFDNLDYVYTYISPDNEIISKNDRFLIQGSKYAEEITVVRGTYTASIKTDHNYKVLPIIKKIN